MKDMFSRGSVYRCFTRTWWRVNPGWPNGLEPEMGKRRYTGHPEFKTVGEAIAYCKAWNKAHKPRKLSRKCEFE
jgi:hypothetical protein